jgi:hypothetical protein
MSARVTASLCCSLTLKLDTALYLVPIILTVLYGTPKEYAEKKFKLLNVTHGLRSIILPVMSIK